MWEQQKVNIDNGSEMPSNKAFVCCGVLYIVHVMLSQKPRKMTGLKMKSN